MFNRTNIHRELCCRRRSRWQATISPRLLSLPSARTRSSRLISVVNNIIIAARSAPPFRSLRTAASPAHVARPAAAYHPAYSGRWALGGRSSAPERYQRPYLIGAAATCAKPTAMEGAEAAAAPMPLTRQPGAGEHFTSEFLYPEAALSTPTFLVVLNYTLPKALPWLWHRARHRVCADGGANRLFDELPAMLPTEDPNALR